MVDGGVGGGVNGEFNVYGRVWGVMVHDYDRTLFEFVICQ